MSQPSPFEKLAAYRQHFDEMYVGGIPRLLNDDGAFLSFVTVLTGIEALGGLLAPSKGNGERFVDFVSTYFPPAYQSYASTLWKFRNAMVHSFNPGPFALTHRASRAHLTISEHGLPILNAEDFYASLLHAANSYFASVTANPTLMENFLKRIRSSDGGAPQVWSSVHIPGRGTSA